MPPLALSLLAATHPYGAWCLLPPLVAVVLAMVTRRIVPSLLFGILAGALLTTGGALLPAIGDVVVLHLWSALVQPDKLRIFGFTLAIGATIGVVYASGGMQGLVSLLQPLARTRRSGQLTAWVAGLLVFFDDYANTLLLGNTFRATFDRLKISREKLAYVVDSTAAPVAGLALVSTWVAVELAYVEEGLQQLGPAAEGFEAIYLFVHCLPYRFYVIQALLFVPIVALLGRDFGPMRRAEQKAQEMGEAAIKDSAKETGQQLGQAGSAHWIYAVLPLGAMLAVVLLVIAQTGLAATKAENLMPTPMRVFGKSDATIALLYGGLVGLTIAVGLAYRSQLLTGTACWQSALKGAKAMVPALIILWLASGLSRMTGNTPAYDAMPPVATTVESDEANTNELASYPHRDHRLYTGDYLVEQLARLADDRASSAWLVALLPTLIFLLSSVVAFSTGTSFGTMGLMVPMVVPLAFAALNAAGASVSPDHPILLASLGSVLAGAIFGDHCSPLSDTTILSSQASGCSHVAHVNTQMPYALVVAAVCTLLGTLAIGFGANVWLLLILQTTTLAGLLWLLGTPVESGEES